VKDNSSPRQSQSNAAQKEPATAAAVNGGGAAGGATGTDDGGFEQMSKQKGNKEVRLLLLGPGESGKSTFFKQLKILQGGFAEANERSVWTSVLRANLRSQMKVLLTHAQHQDLEIPADLKPLADALLKVEDTAAWTQQDGETIQRLWALDSVKAVYDERDRLFSLNDGAGYLFGEVQRISAPDYVPSRQDILACRIRTAAFAQAVFNYNNIAFKVWDIGGQIPERRKWRRHLLAATGIIFFASLTEYDQKLREDENRVRMQDTLDMFSEMCTTDETNGKAFVLMLNKLDLFQQKVAKRNIDCFFTEYKGEGWEQAAEYIRKQYLQRANKRECYTHFISATDTGGVELVWKSARDILASKAVDDAVTKLM